MTRSDSEDSFELTPLPLPELRSWLKATDYDGDGSEYRRHIRSYMPDTTAWIFKTPAWNSWHDDHDHGLLRLVGIPGSGKSVLAAHISRRLAQENVPVLFFYFRQIIEANHRPQALLRDWLAQLLPLSLQLQIEIGNLITAGRELDSVSMEHLWKLLRRGLQGQSRVYAIADALDEMDPGSDDFLRALAELGRWRPSAVKVLTTSRPVPSVEQPLRLSELATLQLRLEPELVNIDITEYVSRRLADTVIGAEDQARIRKEVPGRASGLFLYARLAMDRFLEPAADIGSVLAHLPADLDCMYTNLLNEHAQRSGTPLETQLRILRWVTHASRPLRLLELAAIVDCSRHPSERNLKLSKALVRASCGPLVQLLPDETLSVCHHTLTEFLKGFRRSDPDTASYPILHSTSTHADLATDCLRYLADHCWSSSEPSSGKSSGETGDVRSEWTIQTSQPFAIYAAKNWHIHVTRAISHGASEECIAGMNDDIDRMLKPHQDSRVLLALPHGFALSGRMNGTNRVGRLHIAAWTGLEGYARKAIANGADVNERDDRLETPMHWAASSGKEEVVSALLECGASPNLDNDVGLTPLHRAASLNHSRIVSLLLSAGVDPMTPKTKDNGGWSCIEEDDETVGETPLQYACENGAVAAVSSFWPWLHPEQKGRALRWAILSDQLGLTESIVHRSDFDMDIKIDGDTALFEACRYRRPAFIHLLLRAGANPNAPCIGTHLRLQGPLHPDPESGLTSMHAFAFGNRFSTAIAEAELISALDALIEAGGDVRRVDQSDRTTLHHACTKTVEYFKDEFRPALIKKLIEAGVDANAADLDGQTALHLCSHDDDGESIRLLVDYGKADINKPDAQGHPPLLSALTTWRHPSGMLDVRAILSCKPDCTVVDRDGNTPLHLILSRLEWCNHDIPLCHQLVESALAAGADPNARNHRGEAPLHRLTVRLGINADDNDNALRMLIETLLKHGADLEARDDLGQTVLFHSLQTTASNDQNLMSHLLSMGSQLDVRDIHGRTILHEAIKQEKTVEVFQYLASRGLDLDVVDAAGNTLLHEAFLADQSVGMDLSHPILTNPPDQRNYAGRTALHIASQIHPQYSTGHSRFDIMLSLTQDANACDHQGATPLHMASCVSEHYVVKLLDAGADVAALTADRLTPLHLAARSRQSNTVGVLCDYMRVGGHNLINAQDADSRTPLHHACRSGRLESVATLLRAGALPNVQDRKGLTPLYACAEYESEQQLWTDHDGYGNEPGLRIENVSLRTADRPRPTHASHKISSDWSGNENDNTGIDEIISLLVTHGADACLVVDEEGSTVLSKAIGHALDQQSEYIYSCFRRLQDTLELPDTVLEPSSLNTLLAYHRLAGSASAVQEWCERNASQAYSHEDLSCLLSDHRYDLIEVIIKQMPDAASLKPFIDLFTRRGFANLLQSALKQELETESGKATMQFQKPSSSEKPLAIKACERSLSNLEVLRVLAANHQLHGRAFTLEGRDDGVTHVGAKTALHVLCTGSHWWQAAEGIPFLLEIGADKEARDEQGWTPLHVALDSGHSSRSYHRHAARRLLEYGADVNAITPAGETCLAMARDPALAELLLKYGTRLSISSLFAAVWSHNIVLLQKLLSLGADPNARINQGVSEDNSMSPAESLDRYLSASRSECRVPDPEYYILDYVAERKSHQINSTSPQDDIKRLAMLRVLLNHGADPYRTFVAPINRPN